MNVTRGWPLVVGAGCIVAFSALAPSGCRRARGTGSDPSCDDLGDSARAQKVEAFLATGARFEADAAMLEADVERACAQMAAELGIEVPAAAERQLQVEATCEAVSAEVRAITDAALPAGAALQVVYEPPVCSIAVSAMAECVAECDADVTADVEVTCTEGQLVGECSGTCSGQCRVEGDVACEADCSGTCTGTCEGTCYGACDAECSATDAQGSCVGTCAGTCTGSCVGSCRGTCSGTCTSDVSAECGGQCAGDCDVELEEPRCEGEANVEADAQCEAACDAELAASATCSEPEVTVFAAAAVDPAAAERLSLLIATLRAHYPRLLSLHERLVRVSESGAAVVTAFEAAADAAGDLGLVASACFAGASAGVVDAVATIDASLSVTVEVNVSVRAEAGSS